MPYRFLIFPSELQFERYFSLAAKIVGKGAALAPPEDSCRRHQLHLKTCVLDFSLAVLGGRPGGLDSLTEVTVDASKHRSGLVTKDTPLTTPRESQ